MFTILLILIFLMLIIMTIMMFSRLKVNLVDFGAIQAGLFLMFYALPSVDLILDGNMIAHEIILNFNINTSALDQIKMLLCATAITLLFLFGYLFAQHTKQVRITENAQPIPEAIFNQKNYYLLQLILFIIWIILFCLEMIQYGHGFLQFIIPSRKSLSVSELRGTLKLMLPILSWIMFVSKPRKKHGLIKNVAYVLWNMISVFSGGQRRDIIMFAILMIFILIKYYRYNNNADYFMKIIKNKSVRRKLIFASIALVLSIPLLWYARTIATNYTRSGVIIDATKIRGFTELIFGSSSTGFETTLVLNSYKNSLNIFPLHCIILILIFWIPRSIFPSKPMVMTAALKQYRNDSGNLSTFFVNDMIFSFGLFSIVVVPIIGIWFYKKCNQGLVRNAKQYDYFISAFCFANSILFFKNGFAQFMISYVIFSFMLRAFYRFIFQEKSL